MLTEPELSCFARPVLGEEAFAPPAPGLSGSARAFKECFDRVLAALALVVVVPVGVLVALVVLVTSGRPVFFSQERVGRSAQTFRIYKFRTMVRNAEADLPSLCDRNELDGLLFKIRRDPRVTPVGRWLRRFSLDELPQLLNVLAGHMSLVGPRPPLLSEAARYGDDVRRRLLVKPGLTGLWQVSGRSELSWDQSVRMDLYYVDHWSPRLDIVILWKTGRAVLTGRGAY